MNDTITWSLNTATQKQFKNNPPEEVQHDGPLEAVLDKLLPSMGRSDIPSHLIAIIERYGHGVLELPGTQRWDGLRLYYRSNKADVILDYEAYKSDLSVTKIRPDGGVSIDCVSELKIPPKWGEEDNMEGKELKTGFSEVNEMLGINDGVRRGDLGAIPNRWMGESEINPEAIVDYPSLAGEVVLTDRAGTKGIVVLEDDETELKLRNALRRAQDRNNARVGAMGEPLGSIDEIIKAKNDLKEHMAIKEVKLIALDSSVVGELRTADAPDLIFANYGSGNQSVLDGDMLNFKILKGRRKVCFAAPRSDFDGDEITVRSGMERLRRMQWRTKNPDIATFIKEGRELYEGDFKPIAVLKTNFEDYVRLVNLVRRDIYRNDTFLSAALLIKALQSWGGVVRADRKTALKFIKKTYRKCIAGRFRRWLIQSIWEHKDMMVRSMLMDGSKRELIGNIRGWKRR